MNQKKNNKIIIIVIIAIFVSILILGAVYAYVGTDLFRSDKNLFFKYFSQLNTEQDGFLNEYINQYFEKKKNTPYEDNGTISFNIGSNIDEERLERINNTTITYKGMIDKLNSKSSQDIDVNYSEDVKFPISYLQSKDKIGLKTEYVGNKFLAVEMNKLNEISQQTLGTNDFSEILNVFENSEKSSLLTNEELSYIKDTYFSVLDQELSDENFSKIEGEQKGYKLTLNGEQVKNIAVKLLETLKNDNVTLEKINKLLSSENNTVTIESSDIDDIIGQINENTQINDKNIEIIVYQSDRKLNKIEIKINEVKISISKTETGNSTEYNLLCEINQDNQTSTAYLNMKYSGLQGLQSISEDYELGILLDDENQYVYNWNHNVDFKDNVQIDEVTDENSLILTQYEQEQINNFISLVEERLQEVNKKQMESLGIADEVNPLIDAIPLMSMFSQATGVVSNESLSMMDNMESESYNTKFENYEGSNIKGVTVKGLLSTIQANNDDTSNPQITEIHFNGEEYETTEQNITLIKSEISTEDSYKVGFEKQPNSGRIYRVVINKN